MATDAPTGLRRVCACFVFILVAASCSEGLTEEVAPPPTTAVEPQAVEDDGSQVLSADPVVVFEETWVGEPDLDEVGAALLEHGVPALVRVGYPGDQDRLRLTISQLEDGQMFAEVHVDSETDGTFGVTALPAAKQNRCGRNKRGPDNNPRQVGVRSDGRACLLESDSQSSVSWFENGFHLEATIDEWNRRLTPSQLLEWHWLPYGCGDSSQDVSVGDIDGDGERDQMRTVDGWPYTGVFCLSSGEVTTTEDLRGDGPFDAVDLDGDGLFEVRTGGTTASEAQLVFSRYEAGALIPLGSLRFGVGSAVRCADFDNDGLREVQQGTIEFAEDDDVGPRWLIISYRMSETGFEEIDRRSGVLAAEPDLEYNGFASPAQRNELLAEMGIPDGGWATPGCPWE